MAGHQQCSQIYSGFQQLLADSEINHRPVVNATSNADALSIHMGHPSKNSVAKEALSICA